MKLRKMNWRHPELKESVNETEFKVEKENEVLLGNESRGLGSCVAQFRQQRSAVRIKSLAILLTIKCIN